jgi:hypothetical protein
MVVTGDGQALPGALRPAVRCGAVAGAPGGPLNTMFSVVIWTRKLLLMKRHRSAGSAPRGGGPRRWLVSEGNLSAIGGGDAIGGGATR